MCEILPHRPTRQLLYHVSQLPPQASIVGTRLARPVHVVDTVPPDPLEIARVGSPQNMPQRGVVAGRGSIDGRRLAADSVDRRKRPRSGRVAEAQRVTDARGEAGDALERVYNVKVQEMERAVARLRAEVRLRSVYALARQCRSVNVHRARQAIVGDVEGAVVEAGAWSAAQNLVVVPGDEPRKRVAHKRDSVCVVLREYCRRLCYRECACPHALDRRGACLGYGAHHHPPPAWRTGQAVIRCHGVQLGRLPGSYEVDARNTTREGRINPVHYSTCRCAAATKERAALL